MKNFIILSIILFSFISLQAQQPNFTRTTFWLHGYGGTKATWIRASTAVSTVGLNLPNLASEPSGTPLWKAYDIRPINLEYSGINSGISDVSSYLINTPIHISDDNTLPTNQNFVIAHSLGGIIARDIDRQYDLDATQKREFNGIVTFATPHLGAKLLNNKAMFDPFFHGACTEIPAGPVTELINDLSFPLNLFITPQKATDAVDKFCNFATAIIPFVITNYNTPIADQFNVDPNNYLANLNTYGNTHPNNTHKVAFYGTLNANKDNIFWKSMSSAISAYDDPSTFPFFQAIDNTVVNKKDVILVNYQAKINYWNWQFMLNPECNPLSWATNYALCRSWSDARNKAISNRGAYERGVTWINYANDNYRRIIGAIDEIATIQTGYNCDCTEYDYDGNAINSWSNIYSDPNDCYNASSTFTTCNVSGTTTYTAYTIIDKPTDGTVLAESAIAYPSINPANIDEMVDTNHNKMTNSSETKAKLRRLLEGGYDFFFATNHKE